MLGISPLGWLHTIGSLPAIPVAAYMFIRHGRIVPRSKPGLVYFVAMLIGAVSVFPIAHMPASDVIAIVTIALVLCGYGIGRTTFLGRATKYVETIVLSITALLLMVPTLMETLRRLPVGHPIITEHSPLLKVIPLSLVAVLLIGVTAQVIYIRKTARSDAQRVPEVG